MVSWHCQPCSSNWEYLDFCWPYTWKQQGCKFSCFCRNSCFHEVQTTIPLFIFSSFWVLLAQIHTLFQAFSFRSACIPETNTNKMHPRSLCAMQRFMRVYFHAQDTYTLGESQLFVGRQLCWKDHLVFICNAVCMDGWVDGWMSDLVNIKR